MEGGIYLEAKGLGILVRKTLSANESPMTTADNLVYNEDKNRSYLYNSWKSSNSNNFKLI